VPNYFRLKAAFLLALECCLDGRVHALQIGCGAKDVEKGHREDALYTLWSLQKEDRDNVRKTLTGQIGIFDARPREAVRLLLTQPWLLYGPG